MKTLLIRTYHLIELADDLTDGNTVSEQLDLLISNKLAIDVKIDNNYTAVWNGQSQMLLDSNEMNCGHCANCGRWTTDMERDSPLSELCPGATVSGELLCDECLPRNHKWAF